MAAAAAAALCVAVASTCRGRCCCDRCSASCAVLQAPTRRSCVVRSTCSRTSRVWSASWCARESWMAGW
jgi:hypothetical protein